MDPSSGATCGHAEWEEDGEQPTLTTGTITIEVQHGMQVSDEENDE